MTFLLNSVINKSHFIVDQAHPMTLIPFILVTQLKPSKGPR
jgi:hypothetical protein